MLAFRCLNLQPAGLNRIAISPQQSKVMTYRKKETESSLVFLPCFYLVTQEGVLTSMLLTVARSSIMGRHVMYHMSFSSAKERQALK